MKLWIVCGALLSVAALLGCYLWQGEAKKMTASGSDQARLREALARRFQLPAERVAVQVQTEPPLPGLLVFTAADSQGDGHLLGAGVFAPAKDGAPEELLLETTAAVGRALRALGYGPKGGVPAVQVARVAGTLESSNDVAYPVLVQEDLSTVRAEWRGVVHLPRETTVGGRAAVEYFVRSGRPPLWRTQLAVQEDGSVQFQRTLINQLLGP